MYVSICCCKRVGTGNNLGRVKSSGVVVLYTIGEGNELTAVVCQNNIICIPSETELNWKYTERSTDYKTKFSCKMIRTFP